MSHGPHDMDGRPGDRPAVSTEGPARSPRERILERLRASLARRDPVDHPGRFGGWRPPESLVPARSAIDAFALAFEAAGGRCLRAPTVERAAELLAELGGRHHTMSVGTGVPPALRPALTETRPADADLAVSFARGAVGETGSLLLDARDGRRAQLLPPSHVVLVSAETVHETLADALEAMRRDLPSALGLHSGPSKSADIGQVMVRGVHGPGEVVALVIGEG